MAIGTIVAFALAATPAAALPAGKNARPKVLEAKVERGAARTVTVELVGRDRDDVVRGVEIEWGKGQPAQGLSSCERSPRGGDDRRRGKKAEFELSYDYPAAGHYTISVRVLSGGCGKRPQQRSRARTLTVHVG